ncbi:MAG: NapC/NirT family cytochrome c [Halopseudomonas sp.]
MIVLNGPLLGMLGFGYRTKIVIALWLACLFASGLTNAATLAVVEQNLPVELSEEQIEAERWDAVQICFECHEMSEAVISKQPRRRQKKHRKAMKKHRPCLDCHTSDDVACCHDRMFPPIDRWE